MIVFPGVGVPFGKESLRVLEDTGQRATGPSKKALAMRTNSLISPEEAAGYALVISEEMAVDQDAQCEAVEASLRWKGGPDAAPGALLNLRDSHKTAWIPEWVVQYWRGGRATA